MKTKLIGLTMAIVMAMAIAPAFADTTILTTLNAPMGHTTLFQTEKTQGPWYGDNNGGDWSGKYDADGKTTAYTIESVQNEGSLEYESVFATDGFYKSMRSSEVEATGETLYEYVFKARSLNTGKEEDITEYALGINAYTQSGDQSNWEMPGIVVQGTAPGYAGDHAHDWSQATSFDQVINTDEDFNLNTITLVNWED